MKNCALFFLFLSCLGSLAAQPIGTHDAMNYQAVARDASGTPLPNQNIGLKFVIIEGIGVVYEEDQIVTTNEHGLFTARIGAGNRTGGYPPFEQLEMGGPLCPALHISVDITGGTNYQLFIQEKIFAVPVATTARSARTMLDSSIVVDRSIFTKDVWIGSAYDLGVGTDAPDTTLHVVGKFKYQDGTEGVGKVLMSDANGNASWVGASEWQDITLMNGWTAFGGVQPTYYRGADGTVRFRGRITDPSSTQIFLLPLEFRPSQTLYISIHDSTSGGKSFLIVNSNGSVSVNSTFTLTSSIVFYLDGISFLSN